jgi:DNA polymerase III sliding clamp (beta) subunit (PCNA family)
MIYGTFIEEAGEFSRQITFLSRAVSSDPTRYYINHILIEPSETYRGKLCGIATDAKRMHIVDPLCCPEDIGLETGNWRPLKKGGKTAWMAQIKSDEGKFPDYREAIPKNEPLFTFKLPGLPRGNLMGNMPYLAKFFREFPDPTAININYLNSLDPDLPWKISWYGAKKAVLFESDNYSAIIMPMSLE